jgi:hypothetical protein
VVEDDREEEDRVEEVEEVDVQQHKRKEAVS